MSVSTLDEIKRTESSGVLVQVGVRRTRAAKPWSFNSVGCVGGFIFEFRTGCFIFHSRTRPKPKQISSKCSREKVLIKILYLA